MIRCIFVVLTLVQLAAASLTFDPLQGDNGTDYFGHNEAGFLVDVVDGLFYEAQFFGNPTPSIFGVGVSSLRITRAASLLFTFTSLDVSSNVFAGADFELVGTLQNQELFRLMERVMQPSTFTGIMNPQAQVQIDELLIFVSPNDATSFNVDNIHASAIPEPSSVLLLSAGVSMVALWSRVRSVARCKAQRRERA